MVTKIVEMAADEGPIQTKAKNQLILDKAIEEEFVQTMEIMDVFVENIGQVSPHKLRKKAGIDTSKAGHIAFDYQPEDRIEENTQTTQLSNAGTGNHISTFTYANQSLYNLEKRSIKNKKTASFDHDMSMLRNKIKAVNRTMDIEIKHSNKIDQQSDHGLGSKTHSLQGTEILQ